MLTHMFHRRILPSNRGRGESLAGARPISIGSALDKHGGVGPGFDFLRTVLALSILGSHSFLIAEGDLRAFSVKPLSFFYSPRVRMFFALSGVVPRLGPWPHFAASTARASLVAMASWHWVEKPIPALRKHSSLSACKIGVLERLSSAPISSGRNVDGVNPAAPQADADEDEPGTDHAENGHFA